MKKIFCLVLVLCMLMICTCASASTFDALQDMLRNSGNAAEATQAPAATEAPAQTGFFVTDCQDGLSVSQYNVFTLDSTNYVYVYMYMEVTNNGDRAVEVDGEIAVMDAAGTVVKDQSYLYTYPSVIAPGETAYMDEYVMVAKKDTIASGADVAQIKLSLFRDAYNREPSLPTYTQSAAEVGSGVNRYGSQVDNMYRVAVLNNTGADLVTPKLAVAMYDAAGRLLYVDHDLVEGSGTLTIPNGNGFMVTNYMASDISEYLAQKGMVVNSIKSVVYSE